MFISLPSKIRYEADLKGHRPRGQEFRQAIDQKTTKLSPLFCIEYKFATATSYERMEAGSALFYRQTGIQHPAIDTIRKETKAIKNKLPQVRGVPGEEEGSVGAEVDLTLLLEGVLKLPIATKMTKFFDEEETVLLRVTIDNAKETAQRCPRSTSSTSSTRPVSHLHMGGSGNKEPSREKSYPFSS